MDDAALKIIDQFKTETDVLNKGKLLNHLHKNKQIPIKDMAKKLEMTSAYICHLIRLNSLPVIVIDGYYGGLISISHLFVISRIKDRDKIIEIYEEILKNNLTVAKTEELVREALYGLKTEGSYIPKEEKALLIEKIRRDMDNILINVVQTRIKSKLVVEIKGSLSRTTPILRRLLDQVRMNE